MVNIKKILKLNIRKTIITLILLFIITPIINLPFEPLYSLEGASGNAVTSESSFGIYPLIFMHVNKYCYEQYPLQLAEEYPCKRYIEFTEYDKSIPGFIIGVLIGYLISCFIELGYLKFIKKK